MTINRLNVRYPYRRLRRADLLKPFSSEDPLMDRVKLDEYLDYSKVPGQDAFAYAANGKIMVAVAFKLMTIADFLKEHHVNGLRSPQTWGLNLDDSCIYIEFINRNSSFTFQHKGSGSLTLKEVERYARELGAKAILLHADGTNPEKLASSVYEPLGFNSISIRYPDPEWGGEVIAMLKIIQS